MKSTNKVWHRMCCPMPDTGSDWDNIEYTRPEIKGALPDLYPQQYSSTTHTILFLIG